MCHGDPLVVHGLRFNFFLAKKSTFCKKARKKRFLAKIFFCNSYFLDKNFICSEKLVGLIGEDLNE